MSGIVVGVDGSEGARVALAFALGEARLRGAVVRAVAAWQVPATVSASGVPALDPGLPDQLQLEPEVLGQAGTGANADGMP